MKCRRRLPVELCLLLAACAPSKTRSDGSAFDPDTGTVPAMDSGNPMPSLDGSIFTSDVDPSAFGDSAIATDGMANNAGPGYHVQTNTLSYHVWEGTETIDVQRSIVCPDGQAVIGLTGRAGGWLNAISVRCAPVLASGAAARPGAVLEPLSGGTGGTAFDDVCPANTLLVHLVIHANQADGYKYITKVGGRCASLPEWLSAGTTSTALPERGTTGSIPVVEVCTGGKVLVGVQVVAQSAAVFALRAICASVYVTPA